MSYILTVEKLSGTEMRNMGLWKSDGDDGNVGQPLRRFCSVSVRDEGLTGLSAIAV